MTTSSGVVDGEIARLNDAYRTGRHSPSDEWAATLERIGRGDETIHAFVALDGVRAAADAAAASRRWTDGMALSPLDGIPIGVKANIAVRGLPWTAGIGAYRDRIATADADCVARLRAAGAVVVGTLNMDEGALGAATDNPWFGRTLNPRTGDDEAFSAGGSSGGSAAAVAAGFCVAALGTDTMGSVRIPASHCGVVGFCPDATRISRDGVVALASTFDRVGVIARSVEDCHVVAGVIGPGGDEAASEVDQPIVALEIDDGTCSPAVRDAYEALLERIAASGLTLVRTRLPGFDTRNVQRRLLLLVESEGYTVHASLLADADAEVSQTLRRLLGFGGAQPIAKLAAARDALAVAHGAIHRALAGHAALLTPTTPTTAFAFSAAAPENAAWFTAIGNVGRLSALSLPLPANDRGLSPGIQLLGRDDATLVRLGRRLERLVADDRVVPLATNERFPSKPHP